MLAQTNLGEFNRVLVAASDRALDKFIFAARSALFPINARQVCARAESCVHRGGRLPCVRERFAHSCVAQVRDERADGGRAGDSVDEGDGRVSVAGVGEEDARKSGGQVGKECVRVAGRIE